MSDKKGYVLVGIGTAHVRTFWREAKKYLQPAIDMSNGRWTADYVLAALVLNEQTLWLVHDEEGRIVGALTTEIVQYPERKALALHFLGGDGFDEFYPAIFERLFDYARYNNCTIVESNARFGFWKWFKPSGFERPSAFYELEIPND